MKVAVVLGSSRKNGNTAKLAQEFINQYPYEAKLFDLLDYEIGPYDYEFKNQNDDFKALIIEVIEEYDALILASPIYWYSPSSQMKIFLDRVTDLLEIYKPLGRKLKGKPAALIATGVVKNPKSCFETIFSATYEYLHMPYLGMLYSQFDDSEVIPKNLNEQVKMFCERLSN